jgi:hypothetical protein
MPENNAEKPEQCRVAEAAAAELALGSLGGYERSRMLAHTESCETCRREVAELSQVADAIVRAAPALEPPAGFESRLLDRFGANEPHLSKRKRYLAAAAAVLVALGTGIAMGAATLGGGTTPNPALRLRLASLVAGGSQHGVVALVPAKPARLEMRVSGLAESYWVSCVVASGSKQVTVGSFELHRGSGQWSATLPASWQGAAVTKALLVGDNGAVVATAVFAGRSG